MQEAVPVGTGAMAAILGADADTVAQACRGGRRRRGRQPREPERRGTGGDCRRARRGRARGRARAGARRQARHPARRERAVSLRADEAGGGTPRARTARVSKRTPRASRSWPTSTPSRSATRRAAIDALVAQVSAPVRWEAVVSRLASEGVTTYVEVGPGTALSGLVRKIHREATIVNFGGPDDLAAVESALDPIVMFNLAGKSRS